MDRQLRNLVLYVSFNNLSPREFSERPDGLLPVYLSSRLQQHKQVGISLSKWVYIHANFQLIKSGSYASTRLAEVIARGAARAARGEAPRKLGGSGGMPPQEIFAKSMLSAAFWCHF